MQAVETTPHRQRTVGEIMTRPVVTVLESDKFKHVVEVLQKNRISAAPVVSVDGGLLGMISVSDLMPKEEGEIPRGLLHPIEHHQRQAKADKVFAGELMTHPALTIGLDAPVAEAAQLMERKNVRRLAVLDREGNLTGIVTRGDVLRVFLREDSDIRDEIITGVIERDMMIDTGGLDVEVRSGVVTVTGEIERASDIERLVRLVYAVDGVVHVHASLVYRYDDRIMDPAAGPIGPVAGMP